MSHRRPRCVRCRAKLGSADDLEAHVRRVHVEGWKPYKCDFCNHTTDSEERAFNHIRVKHKREIIGKKYETVAFVRDREKQTRFDEIYLRSLYPWRYVDELSDDDMNEEALVLSDPEEFGKSPPIPAAPARKTALKSIVKPRSRENVAQAQQISIISPSVSPNETIELSTTDAVRDSSTPDTNENQCSDANLGRKEIDAERRLYSSSDESDPPHDDSSTAVSQSLDWINVLCRTTPKKAKKQKQDLNTSDSSPFSLRLPADQMSRSPSPPDPTVYLSTGSVRKAIKPFGFIRPATDANKEKQTAAEETKKKRKRKRKSLEEIFQTPPSVTTVVNIDDEDEDESQSKRRRTRSSANLPQADDETAPVERASRSKKSAAKERLSVISVIEGDMEPSPVDQADADWTPKSAPPNSPIPNKSLPPKKRRTFPATSPVSKIPQVVPHRVAQKAPFMPQSPYSSASSTASSDPPSPETPRANSMVPRVCDMCQLVVPQGRATTHVWRHHVEVRPLQCSKCQVSFHYAHTKRANNHLSWCGGELINKAASLRNEFEKRRAECFPKLGVPYNKNVCQLCNQEYNSPTVHIWQDHIKTKPFGCTGCQFTAAYTNRTLIEKHVKKCVPGSALIDRVPRLKKKYNEIVVHAFPHINPKGH